jgi:quercetin dioxygenase-like cupin family protein
MSPSSKPSATIALPGQGHVLRALGDEITLLLDGEQTGGALMMGVLISPPGGGPPPHYHLHEDEWFIVQEGRVSFFASGQWQEVPVGTTVYIPRTVVHTFKNVGDKPCRMLIAASPAGFEKFFAHCAEECARPGPVNFERIVQIAGEHGIHFVKP